MGNLILSFLGNLTLFYSDVQGVWIFLHSSTSSSYARTLGHLNPDTLHSGTVVRPEKWRGRNAGIAAVSLVAGRVCGHCLGIFRGIAVSICTTSRGYSKCPNPRERKRKREGERDRESESRTTLIACIEYPIRGSHCEYLLPLVSYYPSPPWKPF